MGNPKIKALSERHSAPSDEPKTSSGLPHLAPQFDGPKIPLELLGVDVLWTVCKLRDWRGEKLSKTAVYKGRVDGFLSIWSGSNGDTLYARLTDRSGATIESLDGVRLRALKRGGMLLHGHLLSTTRGNVVEVPQAWWCVINLLATDWANQ